MKIEDLKSNTTYYKADMQYVRSYFLLKHHDVENYVYMIELGIDKPVRMHQNEVEKLYDNREDAAKEAIKTLKHFIKTIEKYYLN